MVKKLSTVILVLIFLFSIPTFSQTGEHKVIRLYEGSAPGSESWDWNEAEKTTPLETVVFNVSVPTLTVFQADKSKATGMAVIICPGGGFKSLAINNEGIDVAKWLNNRGITAFVLKYRLVHSPTGNPQREFFEKARDLDKYNKEIEPVVTLAAADGRAAIAYVRSHAAEYGIKINQIGIIGFSAGGKVATDVALTYDAKSRPDFVAPIYPYIGELENQRVPVDAPPLFITVTSDDTFGFQKQCTVLYNKWNDAKKLVELHIYQKGRHGFGMKKQNQPSDTWIDRYYEWITDINK